MVVQRLFWFGCVLMLAAASVSACGSEPAKKKAATADQAMTPPMAAAGSGNFGNIGEAGSPSTTPTTTPTTTPSTTSGSGGSAGAGSGGSDGAGSGGSAGSSAGMAGTDSMTAPDAGVPAEEDPFAGLFDPGPVSCDGYICLEAADCASLYPEENTTCKFTNCVDFMCTK